MQFSAPTYAAQYNKVLIQQCKIALGKSMNGIFYRSISSSGSKLSWDTRLGEVWWGILVLLTAGTSIGMFTSSSALMACIDVGDGLRLWKPGPLNGNSLSKSGDINKKILKRVLGLAPIHYIHILSYDEITNLYTSREKYIQIFKAHVWSRRQPASTLFKIKDGKTKDYEKNYNSHIQVLSNDCLVQKCKQEVTMP